MLGRGRLAPCPVRTRKRKAGRLRDHPPRFQTTPRSPRESHRSTRDVLVRGSYSGMASPVARFGRYAAPVSPDCPEDAHCPRSTEASSTASGGLRSEDTSWRRCVPVPRRSSIYSNGRAADRRFEPNITMARTVVAVRENLTLLVDHGRPSRPPAPRTPSCQATREPGAEHLALRSRSTADGALVYVAGPMNIVDFGEAPGPDRCRSGRLGTWI